MLKERKHSTLWKRAGAVVMVALAASLLSGCAAFGLMTEDNRSPDVTTNEQEKQYTEPNQPATTGELQLQSQTVVATQIVGGNGAANGGVASADMLVDAPLAPPLVNPSPEESESPLVAPEGQTDGTFQNYGINPFEDAAKDHLSTFAMDVDTASYTLARSYLTGYNQMPPADAIRPEEFINYFPPKYEQPTDGKSFSITMNAAPAPFGADGNLLMRVGIQGRSIAPQDRQPALLVFVLDISGSMDDTNRLGLVKEVLPVLVNELREDDRVSIVVYSDTARVELQPTPASDKQTILNVVAGLHSEGSTYAEAGLMLGYNVARTNMRPDTITRVILMSDGVANVGETGPDQILQTIHQGVEDGVTLSTIGFGMGDFNDVLMEQLANDGNGNYFYVDNLREARRIFVNNLTSTLQVIGYDAKIQVDFNPDIVAEYRLIGYENRAVADQDFRNDTVDAGEVGAGHTITALYEVKLKSNVNQGNLATAYIRYEDATTREVVEQNNSLAIDKVLKGIEDAPADFRLQAGVAAFAEMLRNSPFVTGTYDDILALVQPMASNDAYAAEVTGMIQQARALSGHE